jgi:hypothetical protein
MDVVIMAHLAPEEKGGYILNGELWETGKTNSNMIYLLTRNRMSRPKRSGALL